MVALKEPNTKTTEVIEQVSKVAKLGLSLDTLLEQAHSIQSNCKDFNISKLSENFMFDDGQLHFIPDGQQKTEHFGITRYALSQLCNKLGVPTKYIEKCIDTGNMGLACENINTWASDFNRSAFIRTYENNVRGILSDRYQTLDTPDILGVLSEVIDPQMYSTKGYLMNPERFHARIVQNDMMKIKGEDLFAGIQIDSSDVGRSTLSVKFFIFKQICTNGLCIAKGSGLLYQQRHIGINADDFLNGLRDTFKLIPDLTAQAIEMIQNSISQKISEEDIEHLIKQVQLNTRLSDDDVKSVFDLMEQHYSPNKWGLINSITEIAQKFTLERRIELERIAGDMLAVA